MALTIEGATVGYDDAGVDALLSKIKVEQIDEAIEHMKTNKTGLKEKVDEVWKGHSADVFKENIDADVESITNALNKTHEALRSELKQIVKAMGDVDQKLVESRN